MTTDVMSDVEEETQATQSKIVFVAPKQLVKTVKTALERQDKLDRSAKIVLHTGYGEEDRMDVYARLQSTEHANPPEKQRMRIPTNIPYLHNDDFDSTNSNHGTNPYIPKLLQELGFTSLARDISISYHIPSATTRDKKPLYKALHNALNDLPSHTLSSLNLTTKSLVESFSEGYSIYRPMLLLPHNALSSPPWTSLLSAYPISDPLLQTIWTHICEATGTTHIAINSPIPLQTTSDTGDNILRSPINITPIHGDFGPLPTPQTLSHPSKDIFEQALWVSTTQNGIHQTWAPLYTMFSRGNIREKTRILQLPNISSNSVAVDMYTGIGYFAFSYKKAGVAKVLCFELNPWSVEGLRRAAERNGWSCKIVTEEGLKGWEEERKVDTDFLLFQMSNEHALPILTRLRKSLPPVRHVNLGLLPDSRAAWRDAVRLVEEGGCVRVHENVGVEEIEERAKEVERACQKYADELDGGDYRNVKVEHVERVKLYAPGVVHCVFDVHVHGRQDGKDT